ncbi:MAG: hypothetical protein K2G22_02805 [Eubacterium sp.]|nr:hypothetical protein [Eubacterium sp.]
MENKNYKTRIKKAIKRVAIVFSVVFLAFIVLTVVIGLNSDKIEEWANDTTNSTSITAITENNTTPTTESSTKITTTNNTTEKETTTKKEATTDEPTTTKKSTTTQKQTTTMKNTTTQKQTTTNKNTTTQKQTTTQKNTTVQRQTTTQKANSPNSNGAAVYRTPSGKRYHFDPDCGGKNSYKISLDDAKSAGLTPCQKCAQ